MQTNEPAPRRANAPDGRIPRATYRLQFNAAAGFDFVAAAEVVPYLDRLGVSDLYSSPLQTPRPGSTHGYDIVDHSRLSPQLGGDEGFAQLRAALRRHDMGMILDVVPNHMGVGDLGNTWWMDVLENGPSSIYSSYFDIDWDPVPDQLRDKVLIPILGDQYGDVLERGEIQLRFADGAFTISYWQHTLPVAPGTYDVLLSHRLDELIANEGADHPDVLELQSILTAISYLPLRSETAPERVAERNREKEVIKRRLATLYASSPVICAAIDTTLADYNGTPGDERSFDRLDRLIERQAYRPAFWRVATEEINYRRFFDINDLAAIRVELPDVLQDTHRLILDLLRDGPLTGLRIDHPDGLWNPPSYFRQLQESYLRHRLADTLPAESLEDHIQRRLAEVGDPPRWPLYVVAEKILTPGEELPEDWAVAGTTGYNALNELSGIFVDPQAERALTRLLSDVAGPQPHFDQLVNAKKKEIMLVSLSSEVNALSHELDRISEQNRHYRDFTLNSLTFALREVIAALPVYRTYTSDLAGVAERDIHYIDSAVAEAKRRNPRTAGAIFDFIGDTLSLRNLERFAPDQHERLLRFVMRFQQISGPVMAKGVEDTAFYVYNRLVSLNEVGGHPEHFGSSVAHLHERALARRRRWPDSMLATATHDTKRGEDVRARLHVLSELPEEWRTAVNRWSRLNAAKRTRLGSQSLPSRNDEYLLYQTLVGIWPCADAPPDLAELAERATRYMEKAAREAKVATSWINPNQIYEAALRAFVVGVLDERRSKRFLAQLDQLARRAAYFGRFNSLAQTLIKLTAPGVPDIYQGCELWDLSLVDPDNRRPVDFARRTAILDTIQARLAAGERAALAAELLDRAPDGRVKLYLTHLALELRRALPELFREGDYLPLAVRGPQAAHAVAFARRHMAHEALTVVPRLCLRLTGGAERPPVGALWGESWLSLPHAPAGRTYRNLITGATVPVEEHAGGRGLWLRGALADFPVALLLAEV